jgi:hypothetical protein
MKKSNHLHQEFAQRSSFVACEARALHVNLLDTIICNYSKSLGDLLMSAPSRRPEIRRRRARKEKILKLRKRHAAASSEQDRNRLAGKLHRLGLNSPGQTLLKG